MKILAIESSCDETACAVVEDGRRILSDIIASQVDEHQLYGGVVPEIASRRHCENISGVCEEALEKAGVSLDEIDAIAVTYAPGLIGALLVGVNFAKGMAVAAGKPLIPVHHVKGHIAACYLTYPELKPPFLALTASGGHSQITLVNDYTSFTTLGRTIDDAAGEAFDKAARSMNFPYPGGVFIDKAAQNGNPHLYKLPRPHTEGEFDFSFSGLKTSVINLVHNAHQKGEEIDTASLAASFQFTVAEILSDKLMLAACRYKVGAVVIAGGVAANSGLRAAVTEKANERDIKVFLPPISLCGDNGAMIGAQAFYEFQAGNVANSELNAYATLSM